MTPGMFDDVGKFALGLLVTVLLFVPFGIWKVIELIAKLF